MKNDSSIIVNGIEYVVKNNMPTNIDKPFVIIRTYSAGVFAGELVSHNDTLVELHNAIRIWKWVGAFTLSEIAMYGVNDPKECKFAKPVDRIILTEAIEIIFCTTKAAQIIRGVKPYEI